MGISNEERKRYFFLYTQDWRNSLLKLKDVVEADKKKIVQNWIDGIDTLVGESLAGIVTNKVSIEVPYTKLVTNFHSYEGMDQIIVYRSDDWYKNELKSRLGFVTTYVDKEFVNPNIKALAAFWDSYEKLETLIHPVYRHRDELFNFKELERLFGQILNEKSLLFDDDVTQLENALIWKYNYFWDIFDTAEGDTEEIYQKAISTSIGDIVEHFKKKEDKEWLEERQRVWESNLFESPNNINHFCTPPTEKDLNQIVEETFDIDKLQTAINDLQYFYGYFGASDYVLEKLEYLQYQTKIELKIQKQLAKAK